MVNAAALSLAGSVAVPQAGAVRAAEQAFSYDDAVAALERQSAQSLDIHGGRPDAPIGAAPDARGASPAAADTGSARARPATTRPDQGARAQAVPSTEVAAHAAPAPHPAPASAAVVAAAPAAASITSPAPAQPLSASAVALTVIDKTGQIVAQTTGNASAGEHDFVWTGGEEGGVYRLGVAAVDRSGASLAASARSVAGVTSVSSLNGAPRLSTGLGDIALADVTRVIARR